MPGTHTYPPPRRSIHRLASGVLALLLAGLSLPALAQATLHIAQITHGPKHHFFGYIGQSKTIPWNATGRVAALAHIAAKGVTNKKGPALVQGQGCRRPA